MTGTLGLFSLVDLFQLLAASSRSGRLTVDHPEGPARVYFEGGHAVHAEFGGYSGEEAVYALFADEKGSFEFMLGVPPPQNTIETRTENLVLEASRRLDESRRGEPAPQRENVVESPGREERPVARVVQAQPQPETPATREKPGRALESEPQKPAASAIPPTGEGSARPERRFEPAPPEAGAPSRQPPAGEPVAGTRKAEVGPARADEKSAVSTTGSGRDLSLTAVPSFAEKAKTVADMTLSKEEVEFLRAVDGKRNVGQLAQEAAVSEETARAIVDRFMDFGVLRLANRKPRTARLVTHLTKVRLPHGVAGVDPSIMNAWQRSLGHQAQSIACRREDGRVCLLGAMPLDDAGPYLMINRETLMHADLAVNQPLLVKPVPQNEV